MTPAQHFPIPRFSPYVLVACVRGLHLLLCFTKEVSLTLGLALGNIFERRIFCPPNQGFFNLMEIRQIPIATSQVRVGIRDALESFVKNFPKDKIVKAAKISSKAIVFVFKKTLYQIAKITVDVLNLVIKVLSSLTSRLKRKTSNDFAVSERTSRRKFKLPSKKLSKTLLIIVIAVVSVYGLARLIGAIGSSRGVNQKAEVQGAKAVKDINRELSFPLRDGNDEEVSSIKYFVEKAELQDEIIVKGQRATAIKGRTFLIITLKITNEYDGAIEIDTRDYMRLSVNGNEEEWLAPDIHNDPVEVQAISTKFTRLGFPINDTDENLVLRIGEISGEKEKITLEFK